MNYLIVFFLIIIFIQTIATRSIQIYLLNSTSLACDLEIDNSKDYYFYTSVANINVNEPISYFISKEITTFNISYFFLDKDNYIKNQN